MSQAVLKDIRRYLTSTAFLSLVNLARNVLVSRMLGPYMTGVCNTLLSIPQIGQYASLVMVSALPVVIPAQQFGDANDRQRLRMRLLGFTLMASSLLFLATTVYVVMSSGQSLEAKLFVLLAGSLIVFWDVNKFFTYNYSAEREFLKLSWIEFLFSVVMLGSTLVAVRYLHGYGFWVGYIVPNILLTAYCVRDFRRFGAFFPALVTRKDVAHLASVGFFLLLSSESINIFTVPAKVLVASRLGAEQVGYFMLSVIILSKVSIVPRAIATVVTPHISHLLSQNLTESRAVFLRTQTISLALAVLMITSGLIALRFAVALTLPEFLDGVPAARLTLLAGIPFSLIYNANNVLIAAGRKKTYAAILVGMFLLQAAMFAALYLIEMTLIRLAASYVVLFTAYAGIANVNALRALKPEAA